ncbi:unnamed protein product [Urochloa decumbens]|uniref:BHLH domain-containing protein n=1 Tax=Urochloa decumbens TaxID=240449 RepID=A0ABC8VBK3_9POAL
MAQDGPHGDHRETTSSGEHSLAPPPPTMTFLGPTENNKGGSRVGSPVGMDATSKGKAAVPNAIQQGGEHDSVTSDVKPSIAKSKGKRSSAGKAATDAAGHGFPKAKGKGSLPAAADEDGDVKAHILTERERRRKMKDLFGNLHALMPHIPGKIDKASLVGETIHFIRALEKTKAQLEKRKLEQAVARQAAAQAAAASSSFLAPPLQTAQGMAAMSTGCWGPPAVLPPPQQQQQQPPELVAAAGPVGFQTWSAPNVVLSVMREKAAINLCVPRQPRVLTLVMSVLNKHGIDVVTAHVVADESARSMITVYTTVSSHASRS